MNTYLFYNFFFLYLRLGPSPHPPRVRRYVRHWFSSYTYRLSSVPLTVSVVSNCRRTKTKIELRICSGTICTFCAVTEAFVVFTLCLRARRVRKRNSCFRGENTGNRPRFIGFHGRQPRCTLFADWQCAASTCTLLLHCCDPVCIEIRRRSRMYTPCLVCTVFRTHGMFSRHYLHKYLATRIARTVPCAVRFAFSSRDPVENGVLHFRSTVLPQFNMH